MVIGLEFPTDFAAPLASSILRRLEPPDRMPAGGSAFATLQQAARPVVTAGSRRPRLNIAHHSLCSVRRVESPLRAEACFPKWNCRDSFLWDDHARVLNQVVPPRGHRLDWFGGWRRCKIGALTSNDRERRIHEQHP